MKCLICGDDNCTGFRHMMKSDPHYERLRDPRDKEIERLRAALECVKSNTETRHIETLRAAKENMRAAWIAANAALVPPNEKLCDRRENNP